jgi:hypothetical protein
MLSRVVGRAMKSREPVVHTERKCELSVEMNSLSHYHPKSKTGLEIIIETIVIMFTIYRTIKKVE